MTKVIGVIYLPDDQHPDGDLIPFVTEEELESQVIEP